jgi:hypothetical protein
MNVVNRVVDLDWLQSGSGYGFSILAQSRSGYVSRSTKSLNPDPMWIRIHNRTFENKVLISK